jgi:spore maturation protein SpmA/spore maturation protein SpmB
LTAPGGWATLLGAMMNWIWLGLLVLSILCAAFTGHMTEITQSSFKSAEEAVWLALKLVGVMTLWLGIMRVAQDGGLLHALARALRRPMRWLFPDVPADHPAMSGMILTFGANMLGLGNAATPLGLKAISDLNKLNPHKGTATNAMCLFLAINTAGLSLFPTGTMNMRAMAGSKDPASIWLPTLLAGAASVAMAIVAAKLLSRLRRFRLPEAVLEAPAPGGDAAVAPEPAAPLAVMAPPPAKAGWQIRLVCWLCVAAFLAAAVLHFVRSAGTAPALTLVKEFFSWWAIPALMGGLVLFGFSRRVKVYESLVEGGKEGFQLAVRIIPYLVAVIVAVGMFRASGAMDLLTGSVGVVTGALGMPVEVLPLAIIRPMSGSGAFAYMTSLLSQYGPDSFVGQTASVMQGSMDTTLYILAVYFGSVQVSKVRHALAAGLLADAAGIVAAVALCHLFFG